MAAYLFWLSLKSHSYNLLFSECLIVEGFAGSVCGIVEFRGEQLVSEVQSSLSQDSTDT